MNKTLHEMATPFWQKRGTTLNILEQATAKQRVLQMECK